MPPLQMDGHHFSYINQAHSTLEPLTALPNSHESFSEHSQGKSKSIAKIRENRVMEWLDEQPFDSGQTKQQVNIKSVQIQSFEVEPRIDLSTLKNTIETLNLATEALIDLSLQPETTTNEISEFSSNPKVLANPKASQETSENDNGSYTESEPAGLRIPQSRGELDMPVRLPLERNALSDSSDEISSQVTSHLSDTPGLVDRGSTAVFEEIYPAFDGHRSALDRRQHSEPVLNRPSASHSSSQLSTFERWDEMDAEEFSGLRNDSETVDSEQQVFGAPVDGSFGLHASTRSRRESDDADYADWRRRVFQSRPPGIGTSTGTGIGAGATSGSHSYIGALSSALPRIPTAEPRSHLLEHVRQAWRP